MSRNSAFPLMEKIEVHRYYQCRPNMRPGSEACEGFRVRTETFEKQVLGYIADRLFTEERCRQLLRNIVEETGLMRQKTAQQRQLLQRELDDVERRLTRWREAFETGELPPDMGADWVKGLTQKRDELRETLSKVVLLRPPPVNLYTAASIGRFQQSLRQIFLAGDTALTKNYLRFLIDEIVITDDNVQVYVKTDAAIKMLAVGAEGPQALPPVPGESTSFVLGWLDSRPT